MNKGLQALKRLQGENRVGVYDETDIAQDLEMAEYYLQALDIIKEKVIPYSPMNRTMIKRAFDEGWITQEEYQHLKEVFCND